MQRAISLIALMCLLLIACGTLAWAHDLKMTGVKIRLEKNEVLVSIVAHAHNLKTKNHSEEITQRLKLSFDGQPFSPDKTEVINDPANGIVMWQAKQPLDYSGTSNKSPLIEMEAPIFPEITGDRTVLTVFKDRRVFEEAVLDQGHPTAIIGQSTEPASQLTIFVRFIQQGMVHIFVGIDHVLFLLSLLLLGGTWKQLLKIVTAFTIAHSITLSLAATGVYSLSPRIVEPIIALSIVAVAIMNIRARVTKAQDRAPEFRPLLAFGFGLIHGFGFAGALSEIGLPREALAWALLSFNIGVEMGQAVLVLLFAPTLVALVKKWPKPQLPIVRYGSAAVACMGMIWFVQRVFTA